MPGDEVLGGKSLEPWHCVYPVAEVAQPCHRVRSVVEQISGKQNFLLWHPHDGVSLCVAMANVNHLKESPTIADGNFISKGHYGRRDVEFAN